jgi:hypothetical protein
MIVSLVAISGILAAAEPAAAPRQPPAAVEIAFSTHAGEGAEGRKRFDRDGCYQVESGGGTGGAGYAHDSQAGCHLPADVAAVFAKLGAIPESALVREKAAVPKGGAAGGARAGGLLPGGSETRVVLIRGDGSRWVATSKPTADDILRAVNELPSENQWYAKAPEKPIGTGPQLLVVSYSNPSAHARSQASMAADGRWWCYRSVVGSQGAEPKLPTNRPKLLPGAEAEAKLGRILKGALPGGADEASSATDKGSGDTESSVEVAWAGRPRAPLRPRRLTTNVIGRFADEMHARAPVCAAKAVE